MNVYYLGPSKVSGRFWVMTSLCSSGLGLGPSLVPFACELRLSSPYWLRLRLRDIATVKCQYDVTTTGHYLYRGTFSPSDSLHTPVCDLNTGTCAACIGVSIPTMLTPSNCLYTHVYDLNTGTSERLQSEWAEIAYPDTGSTCTRIQTTNSILFVIILNCFCSISYTYCILVSSFSFVMKFYLMLLFLLIIHLSRDFKLERTFLAIST